METIHKLFVLFFAISLINSVLIVQAKISLGSVQVKDSATVLPGDSTGFKILLFNAHENTSLYVTTDYESSEGWVITITPDEFILPYKEIGDKVYEEGYEFLGTNAGDVKAKPVWIDIEVPSNEKIGSYEVKVIINARKQNSGISMSQSRSYNYNVIVIGTQNVPDDNSESTVSDGQEFFKHEQEKVQAPEDSNNSLPGIIEGPGMVEEINTDYLSDIAGMIISNPATGPVIFGAVILSLILLRIFKRI